MTLLRPEYLLLLAPAAAVFAALTAGPARMRIRRLIPSAVAAFLLIAGLAGPCLESGIQAHHAVVVADRSMSMARSGVPDCAWALAEVAGKLGPDDRIAFIEFGAAPSIVSGFRQASAPLPAPADWPESLSSSTDIASAIEAAAGLLPRGGDIILVTDGRQNRGDAQAAAASAALLGRRLWVVPAGSPPADFGFESISVSGTGAKGAPLKAAAVAFGSRRGWATISLALDGKQFKSTRLLFEPGERRTVAFETPPLAGAGLAEIGAELKPESGRDAVPENDSISILARVPGGRKVLHLAPSRGTRAFPGILGAIEGIEAESRPLFAAPRKTADLIGFEAVVVEDAPASKLDPAFSAALKSYVEDFGGGLLILGGEGAFGPGGHYGTVLDGLSPLDSDPGDEKPLWVLVLLDVSGSMGEHTSAGVPKLGLAADAVLHLAGKLRKRDRIRVVPFSSSPHDEISMEIEAGAEGALERLGAALDSLKGDSRGATSIYRALRFAGEAAAGAPDSRRHIILYSDGVETVGGTSAEDYQALKPQLRSAKATLSVVVTAPAIGGELRDFLERDVVHEGRFYHVGKLEDLGDCLVDDMSRARELVQRMRAAVRESRPDFRPFGSPPVEAYTRTRLRKEAGAELVLGLESGDPLLAVRRAGLGKAWAFAGAFDSEWSPDWIVGRGGMPMLWAAVMTDLLSAKARRRGVLVREVRGSIRVEYESVEEGAFANRLDLRASLMKNLKAYGLKPMRQTAPGAYEAEFPVDGPGLYTAVVSGAADGGTAVGEGDLRVSSGSELRFLGPDSPFLRGLASDGGVLLDDVSDYRRPDETEESAGLAGVSWLFYAAALLAFIVHVAVRERR